MNLKFFKVFLWELIQNVPFAAGFVISRDLWQQGRWGAAVVCMVLGSSIGALAIHATESKIVTGHREPLSVVATNALVMTVLMFVAVIYLSAGWSSWKTDLLVGIPAGVGLAAAQDLAAGKKAIDFRHCVALGFSSPISLIVVRVLGTILSVPSNILIISIAITLLIVLVDYGDSPRSDEPQDGE